MTVSRIWAKHGIKPHRVEGYLASNDPDFEVKAAEVIGLYLNPPQHAAVFSEELVHPLGFVRREVVGDDVDLFALGLVGYDVSQEGDKLGRGVTLGSLAQDLTGLGVERRI